MRRDKAECQRIHAKRRALQRFAINLDSHKQDEIVKLIQEGKATFLRRDSTRVSIFAIRFESKLLKVVYDSQRKTLASVLPMTEEELSVCGCNHKHCLSSCGVKISENEICPCGRCCCAECFKRHRIS